MVQPEAPRAADARGVRPAQAQFYAADWPAEMRGDLEVALRKHVVALAFDGKDLRLLPECVLDGAYAFEPMGLKEDVVRLQTADEVRAALPFAGAALGAKLEANAKSGATLDLATALVGKTTASRADYRDTDARGRCEGATHFVRSATIGAFVLTTGTRGEVHAAAELFAGVSGASASSRVAESRDGSLDACRSAKGDDAPPGCRAVLRIEALPLLKGSAAVSEKTRYFAGWPKNCTSFDDCTAKCERADMNSCAHRAVWMRTRTPRDPREVQSLLRRACDAGDAFGCMKLSGLYNDAEEGLPKDTEKRDALLARACDLGAVDACALSTSMAYHDVVFKRRKDTEAVLARLEKLCAIDVVPSPNGMQEPCSSAGDLRRELVRDPPHDPRHLERAIELYERARARGSDASHATFMTKYTREMLAHVRDGTITWQKTCPGAQPQGTREGEECPSKPCGHDWYVHANEACPTFVECATYGGTEKKPVVISTRWVPPEYCPAKYRVKN